MPSKQGYTIRQAARDVIDAMERSGTDDLKSLMDAVRPHMTKLSTLPNLHLAGEKRPGNHIDYSRYLYVDDQISITCDLLPKGKVIPPHDHGVWESLTLYNGRLHHKQYRREDDKSKEGFADLTLIDDRVLQKGDFVLVKEPAEIHGFTALDDDTYVLTLLGGHYAPQRHYYNPEEKSYVVRRPRAA
jgi:predicted metal-dependent enzyme (double-stranded beta helix superfamily)